MESEGCGELRDELDRFNESLSVGTNDLKKVLFGDEASLAAFSAVLLNPRERR